MDHFLSSLLTLPDSLTSRVAGTDVAKALMNAALPERPPVARAVRSREGLPCRASEPRKRCFALAHLVDRFNFWYGDYKQGVRVASRPAPVFSVARAL